MKVLITGGPSNEKIDEVMKITNMSTGRLATNLAKEFKARGCEVHLLLTKGIAYNDESIVTRFESTDELFEALKLKSQTDKYDVVIHSAAVADYCADFTFKMEDMAVEIANNLFADIRYLEDATLTEIIASVLNTLTNPTCKVKADTKISSMEPNLTVKLGLTPKIIRSLRELFPDAKLFGFKLLENVEKTELFNVATKLIEKSGVDYVFANDLRDIRNNNPTRYLVGKHGFTGIQLKNVSEMVSMILETANN